MREKWLGMANKSDFAGAETELLPNQTQQSITIRAAARVAVAARGQDQSDVLRRSDVFRNRAGDLIGESLDHQGMRRVDIVVMNGELRIRAARFTNGIPE